MKLTFSSLIFFFLSIHSWSQMTIAFQPGFGTDLVNGYDGISTITYNNEMPSGGPMLRPKCLANINSELFALSNTYGGTTTSGGYVLSIQKKSDGSIHQEFSLNTSDLGLGGTEGFQPREIVYDVAFSKLYVVGKYGSSGLILAFKAVVSLKTGVLTFSYDNTFDGDGKLLISDCIATGVCVNSGNVFVSIDKILPIS